VKVLLDENIPRPLGRALRSEGVGVEQIMTLSLDGLSDLEIRDRLDRDHVLFLTEDVEYLTGEVPAIARVLVSSLAPTRPLVERIDLWLKAIRHVLETTSPDCVFELIDTGEVIPWRCAPETFRAR
jgi:hypothetical protein